MKKIRLLLMLWAVCLPLWTMAQSNTVHLSEVTVNVEKPGTLGDLILQQTENLTDVVTLHVSGHINMADVITLRDRLTYMHNLDAKQLQLTEIPERFLYNHDTIRTVILPATTKIIHKYAFESCDSLKSVVLPEGLTTIEERAFYSCQRLQDIPFPSTLKSIGESAFLENRSLTKVLLPEGFESLGVKAFCSCSSLREINIPSTLSFIPKQAFYNVCSLESLTLPEGVTEVGWEAFYNAFWYNKQRSGHKQIHLTMPSTLKHIDDYAFKGNPNIVELTLNEGLEAMDYECFYDAGIKEVTIPSTVKIAHTPFHYCDSLTRITCLSLVPPANYDNNFINANNNRDVNCTLVASAVSLNEYKQTKGYDNYTDYEAMDYLPTDITINHDFHLTVPANAPQMNINMELDDGAFSYSCDGMGTLTIDGDNSLNVGRLSMYYDFNGVDKSIKYANAQSTVDPWGTDPDYYYNKKKGFTCIMANTPWTVGHVEQTILLPYDSNYGETWMLFGMPYDVQMRDIKMLNESGGHFAVFEYDGEQRAAGKLQDTWHQLTANNVLKAGHSYAIQGLSYYHYGENNAHITSQTPKLRFPLKTGGNLGTLCSTNDITIPLYDYPSEFAHNKGWNLVSNPYPCYVRGSKVDFASPIIIWNPSSCRYQAIRLIDDIYVFSPFEAFFVQYNVWDTEITFHKEGRQLSLAIEKEEQQAPRRTAASSNRKVFNVLLSNGDDYDRTRFVINPEAKADYEADKDAAYIPSLSDDVSALYTRQNGVHYAINERPVGDGLINLGMRLATDGTYTLSLNTKETDEVLLIDRQANTTVPLTAEGYSFTAEAGTIEGRFAIQLSSMTGIKNENVNKNDNAIYDLQGRRIECSMFNVQCSMLNLQCSIFNL